MQKGVITLLDVLGWKGIWQRQNGIDAINKLTALVSRIQRNIQNTEKRLASTPEESKVAFPKTRVISISDTIAIVSELSEDKGDYEDGNGPLEVAIIYQSRIVARLLRESILASIPLRGAMSVGEFEAKDNILIGPAIDEVAEWYEICDWIGVIQTPSAYLLPDSWLFEASDNETDAKGFTLYGEAPIVLYKAPAKTGPYLTRCINWPAAWFAPDFTIRVDENDSKKGAKPAEDLDLSHLKEVILKMGPISPLIWKKYENTITFYQKCLSAYRNTELASEFREHNEFVRQHRRSPGNAPESRLPIDSDEKSYTLT